jgi:hypothetical protein
MWTYIGLVGGEHKHDLLAGLAAAIQERAEGIAKVLRHVAIPVCASFAQKRVSFVDEHDHTIVEKSR